MNVKRKESAVKKYSPLLAEGKTEQEISEALSQDEKKYTQDEILKILDALYKGDTGGSESSDESGEAKKNESAAKAPAKPVAESTHGVYEEWKIDYDGGKPYPSRKIRGNVKLHEEDKERLNAAANKHNAILYLTPEEVAEMKGE